MKNVDLYIYLVHSSLQCYYCICKGSSVCLHATHCRINQRCEFSRAGNAFLCLYTPILPETFEYSVMQIVRTYVFVTSLCKGSKQGNNPPKPKITI